MPNVSAACGWEGGVGVLLRGVQAQGDAARQCPMGEAEPRTEERECPCVAQTTEGGVTAKGIALRLIVAHGLKEAHYLAFRRGADLPHCGVRNPPSIQRTMWRKVAFQIRQQCPTGQQETIAQKVERMFTTYQGA